MAVNTVVAILIAVGEVSSPKAGTKPDMMTDAMMGAVAEALGPEASVLLRTTPAPSDAGVIALERELGADAVARVVWEGPDQTVGILRAHVHSQVHSKDRWFERRVTFSSADSRAERGRTLGFAFAALLLVDRDPTRQTAVPAAPAPVPVEAKRPEIPVAVAAGAPRPVTAAAEGLPGRRLSIDLAALGAIGLGGPARSLGASLHAELLLRGPFFARAGAAVRVGPVPGLEGDDTLAGVTGGLAYRPRVPEPGRTALGLGFTLEAMGVYEDLSHRSTTGGSQHQGHLLGGVTGGVEGSWQAGRAVDLFLGLEAEAAFGTADVSVASRNVATIPVVRLVAQAGVRWHD